MAKRCKGKEKKKPHLERKKKQKKKFRIACIL
jgi:hypothetical protein